jgi:hypothetical protein
LRHCHLASVLRRGFPGFWIFFLGIKIE